MAETTLYLVAYDIPNDRRRNKVHKILCGFGQWTQYSFFECFLSEKELVALRGKLDDVLDARRDHVRFYHICRACQHKATTVGGDPPQEDMVYLL